MSIYFYVGLAVGAVLGVTVSEMLIPPLIMWLLERRQR